MKLVKPPLQVREKLWDERFYLGKLSEYEIKKQFVIKKKQVKRPQSSTKIVIDDKSVSFRLYELQLLWEQFNIPQFHRAYFLQYHEKDIEIILKEITELKAKQSSVQRLMSLIKGRERCLNFLRTEGFEEHKFSELMSHLRILTLNVIEMFKKWREYLNKSVKWVIDDVDYLMKLKTDIDFLGQYYEQYQRDPFLLWLNKLAKTDFIHQNYHDLPKDLLRRIRECEILLIEYEFFEMQTNILSRKEAQIVSKYLKDPELKEEQAATLKKPFIPKPLDRKMVSIAAQKSMIVDQQVKNSQQFQKLLESIINDPDIEKSFPYRENLFEIIDFQDANILGYFQNSKMVGLCILQSEQSENYRKVIIEQVKLEKLENFSSFIKEILEYIQGNEITIKLVHYQQNDKLIDCEQLKANLKETGFRWKQQTNDCERNIRYTIYYKKKEYQQGELRQFNFYFHVHKTGFNKLLELTYNNIQQQNDLAKKFKAYVESRKTEHNPPEIKIKPQIEEDKINILNLQIKLPAFRTEVLDDYKYYRIIQDVEIANASQCMIDGQTVYSISILQNDYSILISKQPLEEQTVQMNEFTPLDSDILIPMFSQNIEIMDTFNHYLKISFDHLILVNKKSNPQNSILFQLEKFFFSLVFQGHVIVQICVDKSNFIKFKPLQSSISISENTEIDKKKLILPQLQSINLEPEPINIKIKQHDCICALDNFSDSRKWIIYQISNCQENQFKDVLEQLLTQLTLIDPNIQEVGINLYHQFINGEFVSNKELQKQLGSLGFKWKLQVNEADNHLRYTKFLLKLQRETKVVDNITCQYFCSQQTQEINVSTLINQFSIFFQSLTSSQIVVKRNNLIPFSKFSNKDIPQEYNTDQMFETKIKQLLSDCKYVNQNNTDYIVFNKANIQCNKNEQLGSIYFIQLNDIVICIHQIEKEMNCDQITNLILKSQSDENKIDEHVGIEFAQFSKKGQNFSIELNLTIPKHSPINLQDFKIISKPYYIGIIEPAWYEKHQQMIASMIIL